MSRIYTGEKISGGIAEGTTLVSKARFSFLFTDVTTGKFMHKGHALFGESVKDRVLIIPEMRANLDMWKLYWCWKEGTAPIAIVASEADDYIIAGTIMCELPCVHRLEVDPTTTFRSGQKIKVDGDKGAVELFA